MIFYSPISRLWVNLLLIFHIFNTHFVEVAWQLTAGWWHTWVFLPLGWSTGLSQGMTPSPHFPLFSPLSGSANHFPIICMEIHKPKHTGDWGTSSPVAFSHQGFLLSLGRGWCTKPSPAQAIPKPSRLLQPLSAGSAHPQGMQELKAPQGHAPADHRPQTEVGEGEKPRAGKAH